MAKQSGGIAELLQGELRDLLDAEKQLVRALPKMARAATDTMLEDALREHLEVTKNQVERLSQAMQSLDMSIRSRPCKGMKGLVEEGSELLNEYEGEGLDAAITGAARKVEHYEMAGYQSACALAKVLGRKDVAELLTETLREEVEADKTLAEIAKKLLRQKSAGTGGQAVSGRNRQGGRGKSERARTPANRTSTSNRGAHALTDEDEIRRWAEDRGAKPSCVKGTGKRGDVGMIRLDFPGYSGEESLQPISWDEWFQKFDANNLALLVQETTARGQKSNFNKLVKRSSAERRPKARAAR